MRRLRTMSIGLGLTLLVGGTSIQAQQPNGLPNLREMFLELDANGDMIIDPSEVPESGRDAFERLVKRGDENKDGKLDAQEMRNLLAKLRVLANPTAIEARLKSMDKNGDGKVSKDEYAGPAPFFDRLDENKDGVVTKEEIARFQAELPGVPAGNSIPKPVVAPNASSLPERFKAMDRDKDGRISREEFRGRAPLFNRLDVDKNGVLTIDELPKTVGGSAELSANPAPRLRRLMAMDKNSDGKVSREEFQGPAALFKQLDRNNDGVISRNDRPAVVQKKAEK